MKRLKRYYRYFCRMLVGIPVVVVSDYVIYSVVTDTYVQIAFAILIGIPILFICAIHVVKTAIQ